MILPKQIGTTGIIGAFTPADPITSSRRPKIERGVSLLKSSGFAIKFGKNAYRQLGHVSAPAKDRASDINDLVSDPDVSALIATTGGKGSNALLDLVDYDSILAARKPIIGFSDVGVLLNAITARTRLITFYGPNVLSKLDESEHYMLSELKSPSVNGIRSSNHGETIVEGVTEGRLIGGNLSTFTVSIAGTDNEPQFDRTILFWEAGSRDWRLIDQYICALRIRGVLNRIVGMVIGRLGEDDNLSNMERGLLHEWLGGLKLPVLRMPIFGHGRTENPIWPIGGLARLDATNGTLALLEPLVSNT